ncbi:hypothetical protein ACFL6I_02475 [candidate division KSB1 bacterium]
MADLADLFSVESKAIEVEGVESLCKLCRYHPRKRDDFLSGLVLAEDLASEKGVTLYTTGTKLTPERIGRLIEISENNPSLQVRFKIDKSEELIDNFRNDIIEKVHKLVSFRKKYQVYFKLLDAVEKDFSKFLDEILSDESLVLTIYKMKFSVDSSPLKNASQFFNLTIAVVIFSFALSRITVLSEKTRFEREDYLELIKAAFFHNFSAILNLESISKSDDFNKSYFSINKNTEALIREVKISLDARDAVSRVNNYYFGEKDFVKKEESKTNWIANIVLIAQKYAILESGFFGEKKKPAHIIDLMNVQAMNSTLNKTVVQALTLGLNLKNIFDFYQEMDTLQSLCSFDGGNHSWPYPMTGFKSPTIFICKYHKNECEFYESSLKAVTLIQPLDDLMEGTYARCKLATPRLLEFYRDHYAEIKKDSVKVKKKKEEK